VRGVESQLQARLNRQLSIRPSFDRRSIGELSEREAKHKKSRMHFD